MSGMRVFIFNVYHGFCALVVTPTGYGVMVDCGRSKNFSPVRYIVDNVDLVAWQGRGLSKLIISHPHDDHIEDISNLEAMLKPCLLQRETDYDWDEIKQGGDSEGYENLDEYVRFQSEYTATPTEFPDYGGVSINVGPCLSPQDAIGLGSTVNNSSQVVFITYGGVKFVFPGDIEKAGWAELLKQQEFRNRLQGCDFFIASHHGHDSGYLPDVFTAMGSDPYLNIASIRHGDDSTCAAYSTRATGWPVGGQTRKLLTTRQDGTIVFDVSSSGQVHVQTVMLSDNEW